MTSTPTYGPFAAGAGRNLTQDDYLDFLGPMLGGDGVNTNAFGDATLQVYADNSGLTVRVRPGSGMVRGAMYETPSDVALNIQANNSSSTRIDRVVLTMDRTAQTVAPTVLTGTPGAAVPPLTQAVGGTWQIPLAQVQVLANTGGITPGNVIDERQYLPLKMPVIDSRVTSPYSVNAKVLYDRNPATPGLWVSDSVGWRPVQMQVDTGWVNLTWDQGGAWRAVTNQPGPQYRMRNGIVDVRVNIEANQNSDYSDFRSTTPESFGSNSVPAGALTRALVSQLPVGARPSAANGVVNVFPLHVVWDPLNTTQISGWAEVDINGGVNVCTLDGRGFPEDAVVRTSFSFIAG